jgi:hypothetical protein
MFEEKFLTALKNVVQDVDSVDILIFVIGLIIIPPIPIIWFIVRMIQEWN